MSTRRGGQGGVIVNISSLAARTGGAGEWVHYAASKGAVDTFTIGLAREVASEGIRVNAVAPGLIATDIHAANGAPDRLERLAPTIPMGRPGLPAEVAEGVLWLLSDAASYPPVRSWRSVADVDPGEGPPGPYYRYRRRPSSSFSNGTSETRPLAEFRIQEPEFRMESTLAWSLVTIIRPNGPGEVRLKVRTNRRVKVLSGREHWPVRSGR